MTTAPHDRPPLPPDLWAQLPPAAQAAVLALIRQCDDRVQAVVTALTNRLLGCPVPHDPLELHAAVRAADRSWAGCPYYGLRFGDAGKRFAYSDSAWLVTLAHRDAGERQAQVAWLGRVLATRGMPRWLLERHLDVLAEELTAAAPAGRAAYATLAAAAADLRAARQAVLSDRAFRALADTFDRRVGPDGAGRLPGAGALLAAAVADERGGIDRAVPSLAGWLTDAARFPPAWVRAVRETLREARRQTT